MLRRMYFICHFFSDNLNIDFFIIAKRVFDVYRAEGGGGGKGILRIHLRFPTTIFDSTITFMFLSFLRRKSCPLHTECLNKINEVISLTFMRVNSTFAYCLLDILGTNINNAIEKKKLQIGPLYPTSGVWLHFFSGIRWFVPASPSFCINPNLVLVLRPWTNWKSDSS